MFTYWYAYWTLTDSSISAVTWMALVKLTNQHEKTWKCEGSCREWGHWWVWWRSKVRVTVIRTHYIHAGNSQRIICKNRDDTHGDNFRNMFYLFLYFYLFYWLYFFIPGSLILVCSLPTPPRFIKISLVCSSIPMLLVIYFMSGTSLLPQEYSDYQKRWLLMSQGFINRLMGNCQ